jgi:hypothetical protein
MHLQRQVYTTAKHNYDSIRGIFVGADENGKAHAYLPFENLGSIKKDISKSYNV